MKKVETGFVIVAPEMKQVETGFVIVAPEMKNVETGFKPVSTLSGKEKTYSIPPSF
jgi:hypothetical protein